jgi:hypothetical protein
VLINENYDSVMNENVKNDFDQNIIEIAFSPLTTTVDFGCWRNKKCNNRVTGVAKPL